MSNPGSLGCAATVCAPPAHQIEWETAGNHGEAGPRPLPPLHGNELIAGGLPDATVADFWRFVIPDLRTNDTRGLFAAFLVRQAVSTPEAQSLVSVR
ncbi:hypothetical protein ACFZCU_19190 [Streptomyces canus]|uniref:hypothetical protein n=1 Tax=Streptomyces canus TaxID=58343 RepID=UPI0036E7B544